MEHTSCHLSGAWGFLGGNYIFGNFVHPLFYVLHEILAQFRAPLCLSNQQSQKFVFLNFRTIG
jgi:hypothetical protein